MQESYCVVTHSQQEKMVLVCDSVSNDIAKRNLSRALNRIKRDEKKANNGVSIILIKDIWPQSFDNMEALKHEGYSDFEIDVNMVLNLKSEWKNFDDYQNDLVTKFRTQSQRHLQKIGWFGTPHFIF